MQQNKIMLKCFQNKGRVLFQKGVNMGYKEAWENFKKTGKIEYYLLYVYLKRMQVNF